MTLDVAQDSDIRINDETYTEFAEINNCWNQL